MKKLIALLLATVMAMSLTTAFAVSSKTSDDVPEVEETTVQKKEATGEQQAGSKIEEVPAPQLIVSLTENDHIAKLIKALQEWVGAGKSPVTFFPENAQVQVIRVTPNGIDADILEVKEVVGLVVDGSETVKGEVDVVKLRVKFVVPYDPSVLVFPMIGLADEEGNIDNIEWYQVDGVVLEDGRIELTVPFDLVEKMDNAAYVDLVVLSVPKA